MARLLAGLGVLAVKASEAAMGAHGYRRLPVGVFWRENDGVAAKISSRRGIEANDFAAFSS